MSELTMFIAVLAVKLFTEILGRWSDNCYYTGDGLKSAVSATVIVAVSIPIGREVIAAGNDLAALATVLAVFVGTLIGQRNFEQRKQGD